MWRFAGWRRWFLADAGCVLACLTVALWPLDASAANAQGELAVVAALREQAAGYEHGAGVAKDVAHAIQLYCKAARQGDAESQFALGWIYAYGRGVPRSDALAAYFFGKAAEQGVAQAPRMLQLVGGIDAASGVRPDCMTELAAAAPEPVVAQEPKAPPPFQIDTSAPKTVVALVKKLAPAYGVEPQLALAIIKAESNFNEGAVSPKSAMGLMQLLPETAARFNVKNPFDAKQNIRGGLSYLRWLLAYFEGDLTLVTAAYNSGERTVERYRGVPPFPETRNYVRRVLASAGALVHPFDARIARPSPVIHLTVGTARDQETGR